MNGYRLSNSMRVGAALLALLMIGCDDGRPTRVPVSGQVLIDGAPLTVGTVLFVPPGARPSSAALDAQGRFHLNCFDDGDGAVLGTHRIAVSAVEQIGPGAQRWHAPRRYVDYSTSGLTCDISGPTSDVLLQLTWDGGAPFVERFTGE